MQFSISWCLLLICNDNVIKLDFSLDKTIIWTSFDFDFQLISWVRSVWVYSVLSLSDSNNSLLQKISGPFCECDNFSCDRNDGVLCSGAEQGTCVCGKCQCLSGWTGLACDCRNSTDTCVPPGGGEVCSGHGTCECGVCKCAQDEQGHYSGRYCDKCPVIQLRQVRVVSLVLLYH